MQLVLFADDVVMLAEKSGDMDRSLMVMKKATDNWSAKTHWGKAKVMVSGTVDECRVNTDGQDIVKVERLKYL